MVMLKRYLIRPMTVTSIAAMAYWNGEQYDTIKLRTREIRSKFGGFWLRIVSARWRWWLICLI